VEVLAIEMDTLDSISELILPLASGQKGNFHSLIEQEGCQSFSEKTIASNNKNLHGLFIKT
jgi:hypothetical protein